MWVNVKPKTRKAREQIGVGGPVYVDRFGDSKIWTSGQSLSTKEVEWQPIVNSRILEELNNGKGQENRAVQTC